MKLGDRIQDKISGFKGVMVADCMWLNGCRRVTVQPEETKDGLPIEARTFDVEQMKLVKEDVVPGPKPIIKERTGGPHDEPTRPAAPVR